MNYQEFLVVAAVLFIAGALFTVTFNLLRKKVIATYLYYLVTPKLLKPYKNRSKNDKQ